MDTVTHIVLGACIGEAIAGKKLGKKALLLGAIGQSIPDIDFLNSFLMRTCDDVMAHRGYTHSFLFLVVLTPFLALMSRRIWPRVDMAVKAWMWFWGFELFIHIFLDSFNAYGTGWFEPFSHYRVCFNTMYVADPLFSIWPAAAFVALLVLSSQSPARRKWTRMALFISVGYWLLGIGFKLYVDRHLSREFTGRNMGVHRFFSTPTIFNNQLWYIVGETDSGYYTGYRSIWDKNNETSMRYVPRNAWLLATDSNKHDARTLVRFSNGYYTVDKWHDTLVFSVPRFGEMAGPPDDRPKFCFHYYLNYPDANELVVQRGRFTNWNKEVFYRFLRRIGGN
jgi:inner membrane protein